LEVFQIYEATGNFIDLSSKPISRGDFLSEMLRRKSMVILFPKNAAAVRYAIQNVR
jgi:hypothetical protein